jgi:hypothetical protein
MTLAPVLTGCHVCRDSRVETINAWMKSGVSDVEIARRLKEGDDPISRITLGKHRRRHLMAEHDRKRRAAKAAMEKQAKTLPGPTNADLAVLIRDNVVGRVIAGDLEPSTAEGLRAQEIIDRRAEKGADRDLLLQLAQVLGGAMPVPVIEGSYREVDEEALEDGAMFAGLLTAG